MSSLPDGPTLDAVRDHATVLAGDSASDLAPVADALADSTVVGLGEATHGTHEHFRLKASLFRRLVENHGFRLFGLEANYSETLAVDRYVRGADDAPDSAVDALAATYFWPWYVTELRDLIEWLREYNEDRAPEEQVRFFGFDAQYAVGGAEALQPFLADVDPELLAEHRGTLEALADWGLDTDDDDLLESRIEDARAFIDAFDDRLDERRGEYVDATDERTVERAELHLATMRDAVELRDTDGLVKGNCVRNRAMADGVDRLLDAYRHDRIALWAHNVHLQRVPSELEGEAVEQTGQHLAERYGEDYAALGFSFTEGSFQAMAQDDDEEFGLRDCAVEPASEGSIGATLGRIDGSPLFLDVRDTADGAALNEFLRSERPMRNFGGTYPNNELEPEYVLADTFDAVLHIDEMTRAVPLGHPTEIDSWD